MDVVKVFVSSPGDVPDERAAASEALRRLAEEFADRVEVVPIVWEHLPLHAGASFQDQILEPAACDIVICILWKRLGTRLPPDRFQKPDGSAYASGTEFEFLSALDGQRDRGGDRPALLVYKKTAPLSIDLDDPGLQDKLAQKASLDNFFKEWFFNADGTLKRAFHQFENPADFGRTVEAHVRALLTGWYSERATGAVRRASTWSGSPFRGLSAFEYEHSRIFFGRAQAISQAVDALRHQAATGRAFLLLLGMSGSGKSSLARAGLMPALCESDVIAGVTAWRRAVLRPGDDSTGPMAALAGALVQPTAFPSLAADVTALEQLREELQAAATDPATAARDALTARLRTALARETGLEPAGSEPPAARLALLVDQFEELYTREWITPEQRAAFIGCIAFLARSGVVWVVTTLRSDFYPRFQSDPRLLELKEGRGQYDLTQPSADEIRQMITLPAQMAGLTFERDPSGLTGLDDVLLNAALRSRESLPLLEFVLEQLYEHRDESGALTLDAFSELGGLEGALARRADDVFSGLASEVQAAMDPVLRRLVRLDVSGAATGDRVARELVCSTPAAAAFVEAFVAARLLVTETSEAGTPVVGVAHEALLRHWRRLQGWLLDNRGFLLWKRHLESNVEEWAQAAEDPDSLLAGSALAIANRYFESYRSALTETEVRYICASQKRADDLSALAEAQRRRELELALSQARLARRFRWAALALAVLSVALGVSRKRTLEFYHQAQDQTQRAVAATALAEKERQEAVLNYQIAHATRLASQSSLALTNGELGLALALAVEANSIQLPTQHNVTHAQQALRDALEQSAASARPCRQGAIWTCAVDPTGRFLATGGNDGTVRIWNLADWSQPDCVRILAGHDDAVTGVAWSPDGKWVASIGQSETARVWAPGGRTSAGFAFRHPARVTSMAFGPDSRRLLTGADDGVARLWDLETGSSRELPGRMPSLLSIAIAADGRHAAGGSSTGSCTLWCLADDHGQPSWQLSYHSEGVTAIAFSPDGRTLATGGLDRKLALWSVVAAVPTSPVTTLVGQGAAVRLLQFGPDSRWLVAAGLDPVARLFPLTGAFLAGAPVALAAHEAWVLSAEFSADGRWLLTSSEDTTARLWDLEASNVALSSTALRGHTQAVTSARFCPGKQSAVTCGMDGQARKWDLDEVRRRSRREVLRGHTARLTGVELSGDGRVAATGSDDATVRIWQLEPGQDPRCTVVYSANGSPVRAVALSDDGRWLLASASDRAAHLLDLSSREPSTPSTVFEGAAGAGGCLAFSDDGTRAAVGFQDGTVAVLSLGGGHPLVERHWEAHDEAAIAVKFSNRGGLLATRSRDRVLKLWGLDTRPEATSGEPSSAVTSGARPGSHSLGAPRLVLALEGMGAADFSRDGARLAASGESGDVQLWDTSRPLQPRLAGSLPRKGGFTVGLAFGAAGTWLAGSTDEQQHHLWKLSAGFQPQREVLLRRRADAYGMDFCAKDLWLGLAGADGIARVWSTSLLSETPTPTLLRGHDGPVTCLCFDAAGMRLLTGSADHTARLWTLQSSALLADAARVAHRNFTLEEWRHYMPTVTYRATFPALPAAK
ncbi:MAG: AAA family ATPase [Candidatus Wallbacteria bacterium]|nr:AAA family ATPase [Candidatus Wallbacteria bacterium]